MMETIEEIKIAGIAVIFGVGVALVGISVDGNSDARKIEAGIGASLIMVGTAL